MSLSLADVLTGVFTNDFPMLCVQRGLPPIPVHLIPRSVWYGMEIAGIVYTLKLTPIQYIILYIPAPEMGGCLYSFSFKYIHRYTIA